MRLELSDLSRRYITVQYITCPLSFAFGILVVWTLIKHSPRSFGRFKWLMINTTVSEIWYMVFCYYLYQPVPLFPAYCGICEGPLSYFGPKFCYVGFILFIMFFAYSVASLTLCFFYRYSLVAPDSIGRWMGKNWCLTVIFCIFMICASLPSVALAFAAEDPEVSFRQMVELRPEWATELSNYVVFGAADVWPIYAFMFLIVVLVVGNSIVAMGISLLIHHELNKHKSVMSAATYNMHRTLINILLAQTLLPIIFLVLPVVFAVYLVFTEKVADDVMHMALLPLTLYPLMNDIIFLAFSIPHRNAIIRLFRLDRMLDIDLEAKGSDNSWGGTRRMTRRSTIWSRFTRANSNVVSVISRNSIK